MILYLCGAVLFLCTAYIVFEIGRAIEWPPKRDRDDIWR